MLRDFSQTIKSLDNVDLVDNEGKPVTVKSVCVNGLLFQDQSSSLTGEQKLARFALAKRIHDTDKLLDVKSEEISLLKDVVNKLYTPLIYGRVVECLETKEG